jgi:phosphate transport system substrate-binding protein
MLKKITIALLSVVAVCVLAATLVACGDNASANSTGGGGANTEGGSSATEGDANSGGGIEGKISVVSREDGSGTRSAFIELFEVQETVGDQKVDQTTVDAIITNSTAVMLTTIAGDPRAIGYISLGSLDNSVKALDIDGVAATTANVKNGSYKIQRPFNIVTKTDGSLSPVAQDFLDFILSVEGQSVIEQEHYVQAVDGAPAYQAKSSTSGKVVVAGSSSVTPVMEALKEAYIALNPSVDVEIQQSDSSTGIQAAADGICDLGMSSRELKDAEVSAGLKPTVIAYDGIAIIVNNATNLKGLASEQIKEIYTGAVDRWENL